jgi:hypothetical protein
LSRQRAARGAEACAPGELSVARVSRRRCLDFCE